MCSHLQAGKIWRQDGLECRAVGGIWLDFTGAEADDPLEPWLVRLDFMQTSKT